MRTEQINIIEIEWSGPFNESDISNKSDLNSEDAYGLYQIYGTHEIYGPMTLLYIGKAEERKFKTRLLEHKKDWFDWASSDLEIYVGKLGGIHQPNDDEWRYEITEAEKILVHFCTPPYNSSLIYNYDPKEKVVVLNHGKKQRLPYELSSLLYHSPYWSNFDSWKKYRE